MAATDGIENTYMVAFFSPVPSFAAATVLSSSSPPFVLIIHITQSLAG